MMGVYSGIRFTEKLQTVDRMKKAKRKVETDENMGVALRTNRTN